MMKAHHHIYDHISVVTYSTALSRDMFLTS